MFGRKTFDPPAINVEGEGQLKFRMETTMGTFEGTLFEDKAPKTVANFVGLATGQTTGTPFYDGILFHRCIPEFMVQAGCPDGRGTGGPGYVIKDEFGPGLRHDKGGLLSMANAGPNTGGSQFFITEIPTGWLDNKHAIFGEVDAAGLEAITKMSRMPQDRSNKPNTDIHIKKLTIFRG